MEDGRKKLVDNDSYWDSQYNGRLVVPREKLKREIRIRTVLENYVQEDQSGVVTAMNGREWWRISSSLIHEREALISIDIH